ncbi:MAG: 2'-5' RNA ligase, partial [Lachnospiraceae bacterium]|nr:2'-5' RNA ligase [Lachnospiraceae bacterium]
KEIELGTDVSDILGVKKWEIEEKVTTGGTVIGTLPPDVPHTDETRVQAEPNLINDFAGLEYYITTKMDGSSHSVSIDEDGFHVTGHNYEYKDDGKSSFYELVKRENVESRARKYYRENGLHLFTIQGELCAPGIQQNRLRLAKPEWYVFTIRIDGKRVGLSKMHEVCERLGLKMVPVEEVGTDLPSQYPTVEALLERADGEYPKGGKKEGIVIRPVEPVFNKRISAALSMKVVNNKYLLKND